MPQRYNYPSRYNNNNYNNRPVETMTRYQPNRGFTNTFNNQPNYNSQTRNANLGNRPQQQSGSGYNNRPNLPPKPPVPMEVDPSIHTRQVNYQNRPNANVHSQPQKRLPTSQQSHPPNKLQRNYHANAGMQYAGDYTGEPYCDQSYSDSNYNNYEIPQQENISKDGQADSVKSEHDLINF